MAKIRNLDIVISVKGPRFRCSAAKEPITNQLEDLLSYLLKAMGKQKSCYVKLLYGPYKTIAPDTLAAMGQFRGFENVAIELLGAQQSSIPDGKSDAEAIESVRSALRQNDKTTKKPKLEIMESVLESSLDVKFMWSP